MGFAPTAKMGYIGTVNVFGQAVRAMSSSLAEKQTIQNPDVVDNRIDRSLYQLGAVEVDGDIVIPVVKVGSQQAFLNTIWDFATSRDPNTGELTHSGDVILQYSYGIGRTFHGCKMNTFEMRSTAGDRVEATMNFLGTTANDGGTAGNPIDLSPARVLTWDNVTITGAGNVNFDSCIVREFSMTINNNLSRNYTFCDLTTQGAPHSLFPSNISTGKRHVNGSLGFQGFSPTDVTGAERNPLNFTTNDTLTFDFGGFNKAFQHVLYEFQNINISVGVVTSTANWFAYGGTGAGDYAFI